MKQKRINLKFNSQSGKMKLGTAWVYEMRKKLFRQVYKTYKHLRPD